MVWCVFSIGIFDELGFIEESQKHKFRLGVGSFLFLYHLVDRQ